MKIFILGLSGMLGHTLFTELSKNPNLTVLGGVRSMDSIAKLQLIHDRTAVYENINALDIQSIGMALKGNLFFKFLFEK